MLTTEWARLIYGWVDNGKEIKIDLLYSTFGEEWRQWRKKGKGDRGFWEKPPWKLYAQA